MYCVHLNILDVTSVGCLCSIYPFHVIIFCKCHPACAFFFCAKTQFSKQSRTKKKSFSSSLHLNDSQSWKSSCGSTNCRLLCVNNLFFFSFKRFAHCIVCILGWFFFLTQSPKMHLVHQHFMQLSDSIFVFSWLMSNIVTVLAVFFSCHCAHWWFSMREIDCCTITFYQITLPPAGFTPPQTKMQKKSQASLFQQECKRICMLFSGFSGWFFVSLNGIF